MKKHQFFSMVRGANGKPTVKMQNGFTDGEFNYYRERPSVWHCIDPKTGLSIAEGSTKEKAQQAAEGSRDKFDSLKSAEHYKKSEKLFAELRLYGGEVAK